MRCRVAGAKSIKGKAKASGNPFEMLRVSILSPIQPANGAITVVGYGLDTVEMELAPEALEQFSKVPADGWPAEMDLATEQRVFAGEFKTVCVGASLVAPLAAISPQKSKAA